MASSKTITTATKSSTKEAPIVDKVALLRLAADLQAAEAASDIAEKTAAAAKVQLIEAARRDFNATYAGKSSIPSSILIQGELEENGNPIPVKVMVSFRAVYKLPDEMSDELESAIKGHLVQSESLTVDTKGIAPKDLRAFKKDLEVLLQKFGGTAVLTETTKVSDTYHTDHIANSDVDRLSRLEAEMPMQVAVSIK